MSGQIITPALTRDQWDLAPLYRDEFAFEVCDANGRRAVVQREQYHGVAAMALYQQPFGFTQEEVDALRTLLKFCGEKRVGYGGWSQEGADALPFARAAAIKIAALLPAKP